jgi:Bacteriocin-protection, YdeI or OmpD-Associated/Domain of unknown function (DUF1905)
MADAHRFEAELRASGRGGGTLLDVPVGVSSALAQRGRVPVRVSVNGVHFRGSLMPLGDGRHSLGVTKAQLAQAGVAQGDTVRVQLARDAEPRVIEPPADLAAALAAEQPAADAFAGLSHTHRREYVRWIEEAKRAETRRRRIEKAVTMLRDGVRTPG